MQCLLGGPADDLMRSKHVALTNYTIFVYKKSVVLSTDVLYFSALVGLRSTQQNDQSRTVR